VNAPVAHTNAIIAPARAIHSRDFPVSFPETSTRGRERERSPGVSHGWFACRCVCVCVCARAGGWCIRSHISAAEENER